MAKEIRMLFLKESLRDCEEVFESAVRRPEVRAWDYLVVTAANDAQAAAYRVQIEKRQREGRLPRQTRCLVLSDPGGKRVGSGGATLNVLREIDRLEGRERPFENLRILVLHSGGDSRRAPQFSACGKLFARVPRALPDGRVTTLFDEFCVSTAGVPGRVSGGMLVMSGDVLLVFNALQIDLEGSGAACVSIKAPAETGSRHGVFVPDENGGVREFLHKQSVETLAARGAVNARGMVDIDTGAVWLGAEKLESLCALVREDEGFDRFVNERARLSFYGDFVYPMAASSTLESYFEQAAEGEINDALLACRRALWPLLSGTRLGLVRLSPAEFIHFGSTREWRALMLEGEGRYGALGWRRHVCASGANAQTAAACSVLETGAACAPGCALEETRLGAGARLGAGCVLSGADFDGKLPENTALSVLPLAGGGFCARVYGVLDNPKLNAWMGRALPEPLWSAALFPVRDTRREACRAAAALCQGETPEGPLLSLAESFARADLAQVMAWQDELSCAARAQRVLECLGRGASSAEAAALLDSAQPLRERLFQQARRADFPLNARLFDLLGRDDACWDAIHRHMSAHGEAWGEPRMVCDEAEVRLPARVNFGGGWTDTPPYCLEFGGTVLNAAVLLDGEMPVLARARRISESVIRIGSADQGVTRDYTRLEELAPGDPYDPHALVKAALFVCGVVPEGQNGPVKPLCEAMGGGLAVETHVRGIPRGSGLGTSSVLCAAAARALCRLFGRDEGDAHVAELALRTEQAMRTGGGWQDQAGGLLPGLKLVSTQPGSPQRLTWRRIEMPEEAREELRERFALVYTGQRRMARNLLRSIMHKAIAHDPQTLETLSQARRLAVMMAFELETGGVDRFAALLDEHWALSKRLDAGSSNTCIDHMIAACRDLVSGVMICGAGGGGFLCMILQKGVPRAALAARLDELFEESGVRVWDAEILL